MKQLFILLCLAITAASCQHVYYAPNTANIPMLTEKGETRVNALYSVGGESEFAGGELQVAHALSDKFGLMLNFLSVGESEVPDNYGSGGSEIESGKGTYIEAAAGYLKPLDARKKWVFEAFGGIGFGGVKNEYEHSDFSRVSTTKIFLQPSLSYKSANFEIGFAPRFSMVNLKIKEEQISTDNKDALLEMDAIKEKPNFVAFEPALLLRAGGEGVKIHFGLAFSNYSSYDYLLSTVITETLTASIGLSVNIKRSKK
jgi:hypothetical protein